MREKECNKCGEVKPLDEFAKRKDSKDDRRNKCKECQDEYQRQYYQDNKEHKAQYNEEHKEERNERRRNRKVNDPAYVVMNNVSRCVRRMINRAGGNKAGESVEKYLPYTSEQLKAHLESLFLEGMSWENRTEWHIDHIKPQSLLPYKTMDEPNFLECWSLENLQPLWAEDNIRKGNKVL